MMKANRPIEFIDSMPGSGKTRYFRLTAAKFLSKPLEVTTNRILLYAAPTIALLEEVYRELEAEGLDVSRVVCIWDRDTTEKINKLLRTYHRVGQVVLTTHSTFLRITREPFVPKIDVFFDEARKCVFNPTYVQLPACYLAEMFDLLRCHREESADDRTYLGSVKSPPTRTAVVKLLDKVVKSQDVSGAGLPSLVRLFKTLRGANYERSHFYVLFSSKSPIRYTDDDEDGSGKVAIEEFDTKSRKPKKIPLYFVQHPAKLFDGYNRVVALSAFFTDSQMFHLLEADGYDMIPLVEDRKSYSSAKLAFNEAGLPKRVASAREACVPISIRSANIYAKLTSCLRVVSLIDSPNQNQMLTKSLLTSALLVRASEVDSLNKVLPKVTQREQANLIQCACYAPDKLPEEHRRGAMKALALISTGTQEIPTPVSQLLDAAADYLASAEDLDPQEKPLLVMNSKSTGYPYPVKCDVTPPTVTNSVLDARRKEARLDRFDVVDGVALHGLNQWKNIHAMVFLAALNPAPDAYRLYKSLLPDYDVDKDHVLDTLVQASYRTALRVLVYEDSKPVYLVVATPGTAKKLQDKLEICVKSIDTKLLVNLLPPVTKEEAVQKSIARSKVTNRKYVSEDKAKAVALAQLEIRRIKKAIAAGKVSRKPVPYEKQLVILEKKLAKAISEATIR